MSVYALMFPGQGSQKVGMGRKLAEDFPAAKYVFNEVDDSLDKRLSSIIFEGPAEELNKTYNTQPALMAVSMAVMRVMEEDFGLDITEKIRVVAGHSLGEYTALTAARSFDVACAARLLRQRGEAMQDAVPLGKGGMVALLGASIDQAEAICRELNSRGALEIANDNGGGQIVLSGAQEAVTAVPDLAKEKGIKRAVILPVSAPFHSSFMAPAKEVMRKILMDTEIAAPVVLVLANVTAHIEHDVSDVRHNLIEQITGSVRWRETVAAMIGMGVDHFLEIGSGKVLSNLMRRIDKEVTSVPVGDGHAIEAVMKNIG